MILKDPERGVEGSNGGRGEKERREFETRIEALMGMAEESVKRFRK